MSALGMRSTPLGFGKKGALPRQCAEEGLYTRLPLLAAARFPTGRRGGARPAPASRGSDRIAGRGGPRAPSAPQDRVVTRPRRRLVRQVEDQPAPRLRQIVEVDDLGVEPIPQPTELRAAIAQPAERLWTSRLHATRRRIRAFRASRRACSTRA